MNRTNKTKTGEDKTMTKTEDVLRTLLRTPPKPRKTKQPKKAKKK